MLLRRATISLHHSPRFLQLPIPATRSLSTSLLMPPKRSTRAKANGNLPVESTSKEVNGSSHPTSMLHALSHIPPAPAGPALPHAEEDDDLTPPPELSPVKVAPAKRTAKANGKGKAKAELAEESMADDSEDLASKRKEIEHKAVEEMSEEIQGKRRKARVSYKEAAPDAEEAEEELESLPARKGKQTPKKVKDEYEPDQEMEPLEDEPAPTTPKKGGKKKAAKKTTEEGEEDGEEKTPKEKKPRKPTPKKSRLAIMNDEPDYDEEGNEIVKKKRKPKVYVKVEYVIPDVPKKTTNFKGQSAYSWVRYMAHATGRLGYACLNTVLRSIKPDSIFCSRTCRIASIEEEGMELPKGLALMNVKDLLTMIEVSP